MGVYVRNVLSPVLNIDILPPFILLTRLLFHLWYCHVDDPTMYLFWIITMSGLLDSPALSYCTVKSAQLYSLISSYCMWFILILFFCYLQFLFITYIQCEISVFSCIIITIIIVILYAFRFSLVKSDK